MYVQINLVLHLFKFDHIYFCFHSAFLKGKWNDIYVAVWIPWILEYVVVRGRLWLLSFFVQVLSESFVM